MNTGVISMRYAKALLAYSIELGIEESVYKNMIQLQHTLQTIRHFSVVLQDPMLTLDEKVALVCEAVNEPSSVFEKFARLVIKEERGELLVFIAHAFISLYRREKGILAVKFTTSKPIDDNLKMKISRMVAGNYGSVELHNVVEPSIIGGFVYETDSIRLDTSVARQLRDIRTQLVKQNRKLV
jgi:F-type H+-transporting ATPase subunit delta